MVTIYDVFNDFDNFIMGRILPGNFFEDNFFAEIAEYPYVSLYENDGTTDVAILAPCEKAEDINLQLIDNRLIVEYGTSEASSNAGTLSGILK